MRASATGAVDFSGVPVEPIEIVGGDGDYERQPAFSGGAWRFAAVLRVTDLFLAFPALILAMTIEATLGRELIYAIVALSIVWWPAYARVFRGEALRIKNMRFMDAALLSGVPDTGIMRRHIIPSSLNTVVSYATIDLGNVILVYSILSFLGFGIPSPAPEWGAMTAAGLNYFPQWWWYSILPGAVITVVVIGAALLGDGVRDILAGGN